MKKYSTPEISIEELKAQDIIASSYVEGDDDNETSFLEGWASLLNQQG